MKSFHVIVIGGVLLLYVAILAAFIGHSNFSEQVTETVSPSTVSEVEDGR